MLDDLAVDAFYVTLYEAVIESVPDSGQVRAVVVFSRDDTAFFNALLELSSAFDTQVAKHHLHHVAGVLAGAVNPGFVHRVVKRVPVGDDVVGGHRKMRDDVLHGLERALRIVVQKQPYAL